MSAKPRKLTKDLATLYSRFVEKQPAEWRAQCAVLCRERARNLRLLNKQGVRTVAELLARLPRLSAKLRLFGINLISLLEVRGAIPVLLDLMVAPASDRAVRLTCANALCWGLEAGKKATRVFIDIGNRELNSHSPDRYWLEAVILGIGRSEDARVPELLVNIFERVDLPGWVRGDAGDKLGCKSIIRDRRTGLFRRCRDAALRGLDDDSIDVQFWSMYLIGSMCNGASWDRRSFFRDFKSALPKLRQIASNDNRLSPGYWWPMSAEAEDVIDCIEKGRWPDPAAGERWSDSTARGVWNRD